uniref:Kinesin-like protein n=1 Tax=Chromera velia CCMP2878 TaxID=1169474 RepID=A0A0G4HQ29_9ALVE|eukprot:Cvel_7875.t1-p1 / transcript=Cvel_7875.t1 / gene=Cvel_7875 / organism=Chromera_velia_CCMP2878 / gene_product=Kinesin-related protein 6, putative / transcript_product=Kinesin-related protein 6, putative / location=Cvel_scaffold422:33965-42825(+) / protein_length=675 / sequence_SO=supercontig / SO=protein_coding / is_pseudo=false
MPPPAVITSKPPGSDSRIRVVVRKRPMNKKEHNRGDRDVLEKKDDFTIVVKEPKQKVDLTPYIEQHEYVFDGAYDEKANNETVYQECVRPLVAQALETKAKVTVFAYGQTGSGKTFTMMGPPRKDPSEKATGLFALAAEDMFRCLEQPEFQHIAVKVSFYEIYCGKLFDLFNERKLLAARENAQGKVVICGLSERPVTSVLSLLEWIAFGLDGRTTGVTGANVDSSRSHAILQISFIDSRTSKDAGRLSFIDLAGSERGADTIDTDRQTRMDGAEINKSLLALKECIRALDQQKEHTPFRGSKLTQVLKDSFMGNCRTVMIANLSPNSSAVEHTLNTLRYAYRVRELRKGGGPGTSVGDSSGSLTIFADSDSYGADDEDSADDGGTLSEPGPSSGYNSRHPDSRPPHSRQQQQQQQAHSQPPRGHSHARPGSRGDLGGLDADLMTGGVGGGLGVSQGGRARSRTSSPSPPPGPPVDPAAGPPVGARGRGSGAASMKKQASRGGGAEGAGGEAGRGKRGTRGDRRASRDEGGEGRGQNGVAGAGGPEGGGQGGDSACDLDLETADLQELAEAHDKLIGTILLEEEDLIAAHRAHIDTLVDLIKDEMMLLSEVEKPGSDVETYVLGLRDVLKKKKDYIDDLTSKLGIFKGHLDAEEKLSRKFQERSQAVGEVGGLDD